MSKNIVKKDIKIQTTSRIHFKIHTHTYSWTHQNKTIGKERHEILKGTSGKLQNTCKKVILKLIDDFTIETKETKRQ